MRDTVGEEEIGGIGDGEFGDDELSERGSLDADLCSGSEFGREAADLSDVDPELDNGTLKATSGVVKAEETGRVDGGEFDGAKEVTRMKRNDVEDKRE